MSATRARLTAATEPRRGRLAGAAAAKDVPSAELHILHVNCKRHVSATLRRVAWNTIPATHITYLICHDLVAFSDIKRFVPEFYWLF